MPPLLVSLLGSPRPHGTSSRLLSAFLKGISGWIIVRLHLAKLNISPCLGCRTCENLKPCRHRDYMSQLINLLDHADALVLASPVYFYGFPAQTKAVIDRCHPLWHSARWRGKRKRPAFFISVCAASPRSEFDVITREAKAFFNTTAFHYSGDLLLPRRAQKNAFQQLAPSQKRAQKSGERFSRLAEKDKHKQN